MANRKVMYLSLRTKRIFLPPLANSEPDTELDFLGDLAVNESRTSQMRSPDGSPFNELIFYARKR
jgi:hypothetical protein